jgi:hypothetical protein
VLVGAHPASDTVHDDTDVVDSGLGGGSHDDVGGGVSEHGCGQNDAIVVGDVALVLVLMLTFYLSRRC